LATTSPLEPIHHEGYDPNTRIVFVPAIRAGDLLFVSGVTAAPSYHDHPHRPEQFDAIPYDDAEAMARMTFANLDLALRAGGATPDRIVQLMRFFTDVEADQDAVNRVQGEYLGGHLPTSTTVEVKRLATDPRLRLEIQAVAHVGG
jgi:enamine deaminase RidA (YjgF/YER057c/UK114 family)